MAEVHIVDIDGEQWDIKDKLLTERVNAIKERTTKNFEYSTEEQEIGKWIDGTKLYRAVITGNTTSHSENISLADKNIKNITKMIGTCIADNGVIYPIPYYSAYLTNQLGWYYTLVTYTFRTETLDVDFGLAPIYNRVTFNIEIEYTKNS